MNKLTIIDTPFVKDALSYLRDEKPVHHCSGIMPTA